MLGLLEHDVLSSIEVPFLSEKSNSPTPASSLNESFNNCHLTKEEANKFDLDVFALKTSPKLNLTATPKLSASTPTHRTAAEKRAARSSIQSSRITTIEESPRRIIKELPPEGPPGTLLGAPLAAGRSGSPSLSIRSDRSIRSNPKAPRNTPQGKTLASKLAPSWLFSHFRSGPSEPQTSQVSASASPRSSNIPISTSPATPPIRMPTPSKPTVAPNAQPIPLTIKSSNAMAAKVASLSRTFEEETVVPHRAVFNRQTPPTNTPPRDDIFPSKRRSAMNLMGNSFSSASPGSYSNPTQLLPPVPYSHSSLARRWQHLLPQVLNKHDVKWKSFVTPGCLPLTVEHMPSVSELENSFDVFSYDFVVDPDEMRSFMVKPPIVKGNSDEVRRAWALVVMRGMAAVRLAQGFQFVLRPRSRKQKVEDERPLYRRTKSFMGEDEQVPKPTGASDVLRSTNNPVYLSMTNEIHRISYTGEAIQVRRYVRRLNPMQSFDYQCLMWPKLGGAPVYSWMIRV